MEQDQIISSLFNMLQKNNTEMINLNIQIDDLTDKLNTSTELNKKEKTENETTQ